VKKSEEKITTLNFNQYPNSRVLRGTNTPRRRQ